MATKEDNALIPCNISEIAADISERFPHLGVSLSDLNVPSSEFVTNILLEYWHETFCGIIPQHLSDKEMFESYPEVYQHVLPISNLHYVFSIILKVNNYHSFTLTDITHPTPKRTITILALIENFAKFCDMKKEDLKPLFESLNNRRESYMALRAQNEQLRQDLNNRASNRARREIDSEELLKDQKQKKSKCENLLKKQKILAEEEHRIQSELYNFKQKCESISQQSRNIDKEIHAYNKQVVVNAGDLINKLADLKQQLCLKVEDVKRNNEELQLRKGNIIQFESISEGQKYRTKMLKDIIVLTTCLQTKSNDIQDKENEQKIINEDIQSDQDKVAMKQESINNLQDQIVRLKLQEDAKASQRKKSMTLLNKEYLDMKTTHDDLLRQFTDVEKLQKKSIEKIVQIEETKVKVSQHIAKKFDIIVTEQEKIDNGVRQEILVAMNKMKNFSEQEKHE